MPTGLLPRRRRRHTCVYNILRRKREAIIIYNILLRLAQNSPLFVHGCPVDIKYHFFAAKYCFKFFLNNYFQKLHNILETKPIFFIYPSLGPVSARTNCLTLNFASSRGEYFRSPMVHRRCPTGHYMKSIRDSRVRCPTNYLCPSYHAAPHPPPSTRRKETRREMQPSRIIYIQHRFCLWPPPPSSSRAVLCATVRIVLRGRFYPAVNIISSLAGLR